MLSRQNFRTQLRFLTTTLPNLTKGGNLRKNASTVRPAINLRTISAPIFTQRRKLRQRRKKACKNKNSQGEMTEFLKSPNK
jgi:hypothetical protein